MAIVPMAISGGNLVGERLAITRHLRHGAYARSIQAHNYEKILDTPEPVAGVTSSDQADDEIFNELSVIHVGPLGISY